MEAGGKVPFMRGFSRVAERVRARRENEGSGDAGEAAGQDTEPTSRPENLERGMGGAGAQ
jgi:hypothetical protein